MATKEQFVQSIVAGAARLQSGPLTRLYVHELEQLDGIIWSLVDTIEEEEID